jgi:hypothetical protein
MFGLIWFSSFRGDDLNVIFYQNMPNLHNRYKSAERTISQKRPFHCPSLLSYKSKWAQILTAATWQWVVLHIYRAFLWNFLISRFISIMQIRHIFIKDHCNSSHLQWNAELSDTILKGALQGDHLCHVWFNLVQRFQRRWFKCDLLSKYA